VSRVLFEIFYEFLQFSLDFFKEEKNSCKCGESAAKPAACSLDYLQTEKEPYLLVWFFF